MIAYKVVERGTRRCANLAMFKANQTNIPIEEREAQAIKLETKHRTFFPRYRSNIWVRARRGSIGIMAFKTRDQAQHFTNISFHGRYSAPTTMIIKVYGYDRMPYSLVVHGCGAFPDNLSNPASAISLDHRAPPEGTLFFKKVFVLE